MAGVKNANRFLFWGAVFAIVFYVCLAGKTWASPIPCSETSGIGNVSAADATRLAAVLMEIVARPDVAEGPAHIEGADYYLHEMIRDENWEVWARFKTGPHTIIPTTSANFYVYAHLAMAKLKKPGVLVIMESKPQQGVVKNTQGKQEKRTYTTMESVGYIQRGHEEKKGGRWDLGSFFDQETEISASVERDWNFWFILQKFFFVGVWIVGGLVLIEVLRVVFGAGARVLAASGRRSEYSPRRKKKRRV